MADPEQFTFNFAETVEPSQSGVDSWRLAREAKLRELSFRSGLPVGHAVEVMLKNGVPLRGRLLLAVDSLWIEASHVDQIVFEVDGVPFLIRESESCVRLD